jgi:hypothetical protein
MDFGEQPLANSFHNGLNNVVLPKYPLKVNVCTDCWHSQLSVVSPADEKFKNYLYVSGTTETLKKHFQELAKEALGAYCGKFPPKVCDIATNDGSLMECFRDLGCEVKGVDPAENLREITKKKGLDVIVAYWDRYEIPKIIPNEKFDIITATNVLAHTANPYEFLKLSRDYLTDTGFIIVEFPYALDIIDKTEFGYFYGEHLSLFNYNSFKALAERAGLKIFAAKRTPIHDGSIRFYLNKYAIAPHHFNEPGAELYNLNTYLQFGKNIERTAIKLQRLMALSKIPNYPLVGYGASAKSSTLLNYISMKPDYIVDDNPLKVGMFTPGTNIPILPVNKLRLAPSYLNVLILAPNFKDEIVKRLKKARPSGLTNIINYSPEVNIESLGRL